MAYTKTYTTYNACFILLYSFCVRQFLVQIMLDVHSEIHISLQWCVNYCSTWTKNGSLINFSKQPSKKFCENLYRGLSSYTEWSKLSVYLMITIQLSGAQRLFDHPVCKDTYRQTSIEKLRDILLQLFITNMPKNLLDLSWKCYQTLLLVAEQLKSMPNLANECSRENFTQLTTWCSWICAP